MARKFLWGGILLCIIGLLTGWYYYQICKEIALTTIPENGQIRLNIKLDAHVMNNNHVGNEWEFIGAVNNKKLTPGELTEVLIKYPDQLYFQVGAQEDDKIPDQGGNQGEIRVDSLSLSDPTTYSLDVIVRENRGRYSGNAALIKFDFTIERKVNNSDIYKIMFNF